MSFQELADLDQGSDEWLAQRRGIVTASVVGRLVSSRKPGAFDYDCPACGGKANGHCLSKRQPAGPIKTMHPERAELAASNYANAPTIIEPSTGDEARGLTVLLTAERLSGFTDPVYVNADMWRGVEDEPRARGAYSEHFAEAVETGFMVRDDWGFKIGYSPDGKVGDDGLIEIKSRRQKKHLLTILSDQVPAENMAQLQCGLLVSGRKWIDYISYCGGMPLWVKRVTPDEQWFAAIVEAVRAFEQDAEEMASKYLAAVEGLPTTERPLDLEVVIP